MTKEEWRETKSTSAGVSIISQTVRTCGIIFVCDVMFNATNNTNSKKTKTKTNKQTNKPECRSLEDAIKS